MNEQLFSGCGVALATPFRAGEVDYPALGALIERQIASGVDALILCGTTGEPSTLTPEEKRGVWETGLRQARGRVPVLAGTGGNNTREVIEQSLLAQSLGVDGLLLVTPYYNKTTQEGLIAHFSRVADAVRLPIILYNVPGRTGLNMRPETAARLCAHPRILGVKEACGDISQAAELMRLCPNAAVYSGNDDQTLPMMAMGAQGVISVAANVVPRQMARLTHAMLEGDLPAARREHTRLLPLMHELFASVSPIPLKAALAALDEKFRAALDNDLNTSLAVTAVYDALKADTSDRTKLAAVARFDTVLGLDLIARANKRRDELKKQAAEVKTQAVAFEGCEPDPEIEKLVEERAAAKKAKNFAEADRIRGELTARGYAVIDTANGPVVKRA